MPRLSPPILALAQAALRAGWTQETTLTAIQQRIQRDQQYLAYRQRQGQHTAFDDATQSDLHALALAACWLVEETTYHDLLTLFVAVSLQQLARTTRP